MEGLEDLAVAAVVEGKGELLLPIFFEPEGGLLAVALCDKGVVSFIPPAPF